MVICEMIDTILRIIKLKYLNSVGNVSSKLLPPSVRYSYPNCPDASYKVSVQSNMWLLG